jgi:glycosyltransferase involved in cell wall biosynthesis
VCRELAKTHRLTLLSLCERRDELDMPVSRDGVFDRVERVLLPRWRSWLNVTAALPSRCPLQVAYYRSAEFERLLRAELPKHDLVLAHLIRTGDYVKRSRAPGRPTVLEMTDAISMNYRRVRELGKVQGLRSLVYWFETERLAAYERRAIDEFDVVALVSDLDRDFLLQGRKAEHVIVCSNGVDTQTLPFMDRATDSEPAVAFIGNMASLQNLDAVTYFAREVLPLVRARVDCTFRVVGRIGERDAAALRAVPGVDLRANVPDVAAAVGRARAAVAPVRLGAGIQNKVLESMALGLPVVTSSLALEGLAAKPGRDLLVADDPAGYAAQIERLWGDTALRATLATQGLRYVKRHHAWSARLLPMVEAVNHLLSTSS